MAQRQIIRTLSPLQFRAFSSTGGRRSLAQLERTPTLTTTTHQKNTSYPLLPQRQARCFTSSTSAPQVHAHAHASSSSSTIPKTSTKAASKVPSNANDCILTLSCPDRPGIVHAVTGFLAKHDLNIVDSQQYGDATSRTFFMRVHFGPSSSADASPDNINHENLTSMFQELASPLNMAFELHPVAQKPRVLIMVSKIGHCLNDLLFRQSISQLPISVPLIVSNHRDYAPLAATYNIPFHHLPVTADTKVEQEAQILALIAEHKIDLIVLARYMQVLSPGLCTAMSGRIINIHHSFLPSFKGAKPYHQAYDRGVKIIGATAHFVTSDLDEGPIIEQNVVRVGHDLGPRELTIEGSNVESNVLASAVKWVAERRVLMNGRKTVVFN